jgi:rhamnogalacturonyl hydrolase YesR
MYTLQSTLILALVFITLIALTAAQEEVFSKTYIRKAAQEEVFSKKYISQAMLLAFQWQQNHPKHELNDWTNGAYYAGVTQAWKATGDNTYLNGLLEMGQKLGWYPGKRSWYHADDIAICMSFIDVYQADENVADIKPTKKALDWAVLYADHHRWGNPEVQNITWWWCDALFMGPPVFAKFANLTGNDIYLKASDKWYKESYDQLYDQEEHLWSRDLRYKLKPDGTGKTEANGKKIFWSRGNGWVFGGLAILLNDMPKDYPNRGFYEKIFVDMAAKIQAIQPEDGAWRSSLLYPEGHSHGESSGTGFYVFGLAYGVRSGLLQAEDYLYTIKKGWKALLANQQPDGMIGYVQPIGEAPWLQVNKTMWEVYGTGSFLCAGAEVLRLGLEE